ncbi:MAG: glycosyltransferase family 2 protein [Thermoleophilaceae bacterium]
MGPRPVRGFLVHGHHVDLTPEHDLDRRDGVSVLVPVLNEGATIRETVVAMQAQRFDGRLEFLFLDGASEDDTRGILEQLARDDPRLRILSNPARRIPQALNIGLRHARGAFIARMDAHTIYPPDYLACGVERLERGDVEWASGPQVAHGTGAWSRRVERALGSVLGVGGATFRRAQTEIEVDTGFTGVWRRETLEQHGGWDENWPVNEDAELAARVRAEGGTIVCLPDMAARYTPRDSLPALARQYWRYGQYRAKTSRRHPESMRRSHLLAPGVVLAMVASLVPGGRLSWAPRLGVAAYVLSVLTVSLGRAARPMHREGPALAAVFATMHIAWGLGFLVGSARFGPPLGALKRMRP